VISLNPITRDASKSTRFPITPSLQHYKMLRNRGPLEPITPNVTPRHELTPYQRGLIIGARLAGATIPTIAKAQNRSINTIKSTLRRAHLQPEGDSQPRSGRPKVYSDREKRALIRHCRLHPKHTYAQVRHALGSEISTSTIKLILKEAGISNWRAKQTQSSR